jgi:hypothetical protein
MAGTNTSFRPGSQGDLGASLNQLGNSIYGFVRPFIQPTPYGTNPWAGSPGKGSQYYGPAYGNINVKPGGLRNYGSDYKREELKAGAAAENFRPGAGFPGQQGRSSSPAAERAYQQEVSRVAQLTAQDPDLQRYEVARKIAAAKGATPEQVQSAEDTGMRIWAERNKTLAGKVKPGQAGYDVIQGVLNAGAMGAPVDLPFAPDSLLGTNALQSIPSYAGASDLQPVGLPLPRTEFNTPQNQLQAQMFNRFLSEPSQPPVVAPPVNPAEATYEGATNLSPIDGISLDPFSFNTPAEKNRSDLFQRLLNSSLSAR